MKKIKMKLKQFTLTNSKLITHKNNLPMVIKMKFAVINAPLLLDAGASNF